MGDKMLTYEAGEINSQRIQHLKGIIKELGINLQYTKG